MSQVDILPNSKEPVEAVEWHQKAQDLFITAVESPEQALAQEGKVVQGAEETLQTVDLAAQTAGQSPEQTQKTLQQGALDRIFTWWKQANTTERVVAVAAGAAVIALGAYIIKKAIDGVVKLGSWVIEKLTGYRNTTIEGIVKVGLGVGVAKAFYDVVTSEEALQAFVADGWSGVGELFLTKVLENAIDLGAIGEEKWEALREKIPQLPTYDKVEELINSRGDALEKAKAAMAEMREKLEAEGEGAKESLWDRFFGIAPIPGKEPKEEPEEDEPRPVEEKPKESRPEYDKETHISVYDLKARLKTQIMDSTLDIKRDSKNNPEVAGGIFVYTPLDTAALKTTEGCITALRWLLPTSITQAGTRLGLIMSLYAFMDAADERYDDELIPKNEEDYMEWVNTHEMFAENELLRKQMIKEKEVVLGIANNDLNVWKVLSDDLADAGYQIDQVADLILDAINPTGELKVVRVNRACVSNLRDVIKTVRRNKYPKYKKEFDQVDKLIEEIENSLVGGNMHVSPAQIKAIEEAIDGLGRLDGVELDIEFSTRNDEIVSYQIHAPGAGSVADYRGNLSIESSFALSQSLAVADYLHPNVEGAEWGVLFRNAREASLEQVRAAKNLEVHVVFYNHFAYIIEGTTAFIVGGADFMTSIGVEDGQVTLDDDFVIEEYLAPYGKGLAVVTIYRSIKHIAMRDLWSIPGSLVRSTVYPAEAVLSVTKLKDKALKAKYKVLQWLAEGKSLSQTAQKKANLYKAIAELYDSQASFLKRGTPWYSSRYKRAKIQELDSLLKGLLDDDTYNEVFRLLKDSGMDYKVVRDEVLPTLKKALKELGEEVDELLDEADEIRPRGAASEADEVVERAATEGDEVVERAASEVDEAGEKAVKEALDDLDLNEKQMAEMLEELQKPHWKRALAGSLEILGHNVAPVFIVYMAYDMKYSDAKRDPQNTVAMHVGFMSGAYLAMKGAEKGKTGKQKVLLALVGALTPVLAAFGVQIESVEDWINEKIIAGDFSKAFWNQAEDSLGTMEFYIANRLFFTGAIGKALGSKVDDVALRPLMGMIIKNRVAKKIRDIFIREGVKNIAKRIGIVLATKGASATAVNVVPIAGQVASIGLWLWTAWDLKKIYDMYAKAQKVEALFDSQAEKPAKSVNINETGERSLHDEFESFKQGTPFADLTFATLPPDIRTNFILERYQDLPDCLLTIQREDGSSETSHWMNGNVLYVKIVTGEETIELTEEDLNTEPANVEPPKEFIPIDIPYADLEAAADHGGEAIMEDYFKMQISNFRKKTEWSKLDPEVVNPKKIIVRRTGMDFDTIVMEREGDKWSLKSEKTDFEFAGNYTFHSGLAYAGLVLHSIGFLYDEVHVEKHTAWQSEDGKMDPFYLDDKEIRFSKDDALDKRLYGRDWVDFYVNNLKLRRESLVVGLNQYFKLHAKELDLIGD